MLHKARTVILPETFDLLLQLQRDENLKEFFLVGGTALALQLGHRFSIDLDLFSNAPFEVQPLIDHLSTNYAFQLNSIAPNTLLGNIKGIKVDFITHAYPLIESLIEEESIKLASILDIAAMKLNAISISGQRLKDFIDMYFILEHYSLSETLDAYQKKYTHSNAMIPLKALTYFDDLNLDLDPPIMTKKLKVDSIKKRLIQAVRKTDQIF